MKTEDTTVVALLHDVVEDSGYTFEDLYNMGFNEIIINALRLLTHNDGTDYMEYVSKIKFDPIAKVVKLADLRHNSDLSRLDVIDSKAIERRDKYLKAIAFLEE
jgi:(p)ppGpp synthase/HD superfamily hydrolase